jgi:hypothetical protein
MKPLNTDLTLLVLASKESGETSIACLGDTELPFKEGELWRGTQSGRYVIHSEIRQPDDRAMDFRWSNSPSSPFESDERLVFIAEVRRQLAAQTSAWIEAARTTLRIENGLVGRFAQ